MCLSCFHALPADKSIDIIEEEGGKADNNGKIAKLRHTRQCPEYNQHQIIGGIGDREIWISSECEVDRKKACGNRNRAWDKVCGMEISEDSIKGCGDGCGKHPHQADFSAAEGIDPDLSLISVIRISEP